MHELGGQSCGDRQSSSAAASSYCITLGYLNVTIRSFERWCQAAFPRVKETRPMTFLQSIFAELFQLLTFQYGATRQSCRYCTLPPD
jgi:hypothetical protein